MRKLIKTDIIQEENKMIIFANLEGPYTDWGITIDVDESCDYDKVLNTDDNHTYHFHADSEGGYDNVTIEKIAVNTFFYDDPSKRYIVSNDGQGVITELGLAAITIEDDYTRDIYKITLVDEEVGNMTENMKYVKIHFTTDSLFDIYSDGVFYNKPYLYSAEVNFIKSTCNTCLDANTVENITTLAFEKQLIDDAIASSDYVEALKVYCDIARLLNLNQSVYELS